MSTDTTTTDGIARGWVTLATDTGMGKTHVTAHLARLLRERGQTVRARKPVETGCEARDGEYWPADGARLHEAAGGVDSLETVCPIRFATPVAAPEAARREGQELRFERDLAPLLAPSREPDGTLWLIESAGGLLSPLAEDALNVDLARYTGLPVLLISPDRLGTLSSTLAAAEALDRRGIQLDAIILNQRPEDRENEYPPDNVSVLRQWLPALAPGAANALVLSYRGQDQDLAPLLP